MSQKVALLFISKVLCDFHPLSKKTKKTKVLPDISTVVTFMIEGKMQ